MTARSDLFCEHCEWLAGEEPEPVMESGWLDLEDEERDLEQEYGCRLESLYEADLFQILDRFRPGHWLLISAKWDERLCGISYEYQKGVRA